VVGAGPLGLEAAWALAKLGLEVHLLEHGSRLLAKMLDEPASRMLADIVARAGITLHLSASSESVTAQGVRLAGGRDVPGEVVLFSTGVRPNLELAKSAGISVNRGVVVDANMRTSEPWIFAAGDVAEFAGAPGGTWPVAMGQGKVAGANAARAARAGAADPAGALIEYTAVPPSYTLMVMGTRIFTIGEAQAEEGAEVTTVVSEDEARGIRRKLVVRGRKLVGGLLFGDLSKSDKIRDGVERGVELPLAQHVAAPNYVEVMEMLVDALAAGA
jgi:nitrite reductase (NADH) large subunit